MIRRFLAFFLFVFFLTPLLSEVPAEKKDEKQISPVERFLYLRYIYLNWSKGLYGSRKAYEHELREYCRTLLYKKIRTEKDYILVSPGSLVKGEVVTKFKFSRWLVLTGPVDRKSLGALIKKDSGQVKRWWRTRRFLSLSGRVVWFRLTRDAYGPIVELQVDMILLHEDK